MKILILALSGIGDALMFTPALHLLRKKFPSAQIDALVMFKGVKDMYERNGNINQVIFFDFLKEGGRKSFSFLRKFRGSYDASINVYPSNRKEYNVISFFIGAKKRAAAEYLRRDFQNLGWLNNIRVTENDKQHNVITNIKLVEKLAQTTFTEEPDLEFLLTKNDIEFAEQYLKKLNILNDDLIVGFHPGSAVFKNHIMRRWEPEKFAALGKKLIQEQKAKVLVFGGPEEEELKQLIINEIGSPNAFSVQAGNLAESAAVMKRCNVFVSNDSSLMHVASAMKLKTVAIIGPTNPFYIHPWKTDHHIATLDLECAPCFIYSPRPLKCFRDDIKFKCIKELSVEFAYSAVKRFIA